MVYGAAPHSGEPTPRGRGAPLVDREGARGARGRGPSATAGPWPSALLVSAGVVTTPRLTPSPSPCGVASQPSALPTPRPGRVGPLKYGGKHANKVAHAGKSLRHGPFPVPHAERVAAASSVYHRLPEGEGDQGVGGDDITDDPSRSSTISTSGWGSSKTTRRSPKTTSRSRSSARSGAVLRRHPRVPEGRPRRQEQAPRGLATTRSSPTSRTSSRTSTTSSRRRASKYSCVKTPTTSTSSPSSTRSSRRARRTRLSSPFAPSGLRARGARPPSTRSRSR